MDYQGETLGALSVAKRPGETLTPVEGKLMSDLAAQAGLVLHNIGLTEQLRARLAELRASRLRIVTAQDEQRRRIERDIHDGAQQQLLGIADTLAVAQKLAGQDEERERALVARLKAETSGALGTLRDLARGIYPPLLADQGLPAAVCAQAGKAPGPVEVSTDGVGRYPPEIETAIYFCCVEALQNAARHAPGSAVRVSLAEDGVDVAFTIADDGPGFDPAATTSGTGLRNMSDRLAALGGSCQVELWPRARNHHHRADQVGRPDGRKRWCGAAHRPHRVRKLVKTGRAHADPAWARQWRTSFRVLLALPGGQADSVASKSPTAARITARFWRPHDDGDADSDGGTECRLPEDRRDANKPAGLVWRG